MSNYAWSGGKCRVPMWIMGSPAGICGETSFGPQLPAGILWVTRLWDRDRVPYCNGPCCHDHGGPKEGDPILFQDGYDNKGRRMWCAVMPDFQNLQESPAGFSVDPVHALQKLRDTIELEKSP